MAEPAKRVGVRLSDVAQRAGCSAATVSRVLNAPDTVNADARRRVEAAVRELGYTRNGAARALRSRRSHIVGVVLPTVRQPIYAELVGALQDRLAAQGYALIVTTSGHSRERELAQVRVLAERGVDGLVLVGHAHLDALYDLLDALEVPAVSVYSYRHGSPRPMVGFDDEAAVERVVAHLHGLGHRAFAVLSGAVDESDRALGRVRGMVRALERRGLDLPPHRRREEEISFRGGRRGLAALLDAGEPPTAVVCANDVLAMGALLECAARDVSVPGALSVTGFDDLPGAAQFIPALTTVAIPSEEMGWRAADYLLARVDGRPCANQVLLDTRLVLRGSTAPPPEAPHPA